MSTRQISGLLKTEGEKEKLIPFLDDLTEMRYKIKSVTVPPVYHEEFRTFWRKAVNCFASANYGTYNMATIILADNAKRVTVEFWAGLETYDSVLKRYPSACHETTIDACARFRASVFNCLDCFLKSFKRKGQP